MYVIINHDTKVSVQSRGKVISLGFEGESLFEETQRQAGLKK